MPLNFRRPGRALALLAAPCVPVLLAACGLFDTDRKVEKPPPTVVSGSGASVTVRDPQSGDPVELRAGQDLTVQLRLGGTAVSDWSLVDFQPGVLTEIGKPRFQQDVVAGTYGEIAGTQSWRFTAVKPGQVTLRFELRVPRSRDPASATATFPVTVR